MMERNGPQNRGRFSFQHSIVPHVPPLGDAALLHFARANPIMAPHALAGRQIARVDDSDGDRAPPPCLRGADVPGDRHLRHRRPEDQSRGTARHPGHVAAVGRRRVRHSRLLLAHSCPPPPAGLDLPVSPSAVRRRPDYHRRPSTSSSSPSRRCSCRPPMPGSSRCSQAWCTSPTCSGGMPALRPASGSSSRSSYSSRS